ncbi:MAG: glycosyltransferase involved in cell wall biosynthesis [Parvicella sp.]
MKKILFIASHRFNRAPNQRYRFEQYFDFLNQNGFECVLSNIISEEDDVVLYQKGSYFSKLKIALKSCRIRRADVKRAKDFDLIVICREAILTRSIRFEKRLTKSGVPTVFDFDDAIWVKDVSAGNKWLSFLKNASKINDILPLCDHVTAGNQYLADYAKKYNPNVTIIPSTIDTERYVPLERINKKVTIGWVGSHTTVKHFELVESVYERLLKKYGDKIQFKVIGDTSYSNPKLNIIGEPWINEQEVELFNSIDIGVMPLDEDEWTRGKCGMKGLLYMSVAKPSVMSAVGMNTDIVNHGVNGFTPVGDNQWFDALCILIENPELRGTIGIEARKTIVERYSKKANQVKYLRLYNKLCNVEVKPPVVELAN